MTSRTQRTLIRASAGTGKTFRLSGHFLTQLFNGHAPESILATTFTRKAAGEILGRVLLRLADAADNDATAKELGRQLKLPSGKVTQKTAQVLLERLASELHRVRVCTLDSFFQQLARCLSPELGLPPGWTIIDEATDQDLRAQAIDAVLAQHAGNEAV
jgi:ATP-dependent exoDNAse (exonuclease V) beta subunit